MTKFFVDQHGCAKNQVDGELIINRLCKAGYEQTFNPEEAAVIIVNSCGFIESAKEESLSAVYSAKAAYPNAKIVLAGCLAERYASVFKEELPEVDGLFGNGDLDVTVPVINDVLKEKRPFVTMPQKGISGGERKLFLNYPASAFIKITEGCDNCCNYCAIPVIRGQLRSRPAKEIISEIKELYAKGVFEFNLIGQDLAAFGTGQEDSVYGKGVERLALIDEELNAKEPLAKSALRQLLEEIAALPGNFWVRLLYIHPDHFPLDILPILQKDKRILPYFDIPFQSGDDSVIERMGRRGTGTQYIQLIEKIREALPETALRTTFLTGFPGETDEQAQNTEAFLKKLQSDWSGCFPYSKEEDTPAYTYKHQVSKKLSHARADRLNAIQSEITRNRLSSLRAEKEYDVLIEDIIEGNEGLAVGRAWFQAPEVDGNVVVRYDRENPAENDFVKSGRLVRVKAVSTSDVDVDSIFVSDSPLNNHPAQSDLRFAQNND